MAKSIEKVPNFWEGVMKWIIISAYPLQRHTLMFTLASAQQTLWTALASSALGGQGMTVKTTNNGPSYFSALK